MKKILIGVLSTLFLAPFISNISVKAESKESTERLSLRENTMANQAVDKTNSILLDFARWQNNPETIKKIRTIASLMHQSSQHYALSARYGFKVKQPTIYPDLWMALMQLDARRSFTNEQLSKVLLQMIPALQASDTFHVNQLALQTNNLRQDMQKSDNEFKQIAQIVRIRNDQGLINTLQNSGEMFKKFGERQLCVYDDRPYGSENQVASNPSKYCNGSYSPY